MTGASLAPTMLPKARALTDALLAPAPPAGGGVPAAEIAARIGESARRLVQAAGGAERLLIDRWFLHSAMVEPDRLASPAPFAWSPLSARRTLGLAATRRCVLGQSRTPTQAVDEVTADVVRGDRRAGGHGAHGGLGGWLVGVPAGALAVVRAEAIRWTTLLFGALEWDRLGDRGQVGQGDLSWLGPGRRVALRGRAEVRVQGTAEFERRGGRPAGAATSGRPALFTVIGGRPGPGSREELGLSALVPVLLGREPPARVLGWWPECGRAHDLAIDAAALQATADAVITGLEVAVRVIAR